MPQRSKRRPVPKSGERTPLLHPSDEESRTESDYSSKTSGSTIRDFIWRPFSFSWFGYSEKPRKGSQRKSSVEEIKAERKRTPFPWHIFLTAIIVCAGGSLHHGYLLTVINPSEWVFRAFINETITIRYGYNMTDSDYRYIWSFVLNLQAIGAALASLPLVKLSETLGRRRTLYVSSGCTLVGLLLHIISKASFSFELIAIGRFLAGFGSGLAVALEPMYLTEISPVDRRGFVGSMTGVFVELGFILGGVVALPEVLGTPKLWPVMYVVEVIPVIILLLLLPFIYESPKYLLARGKVEECRQSLKFFGHQNVEASVHEIELEIRTQTKRVTLKEVWQKPHLRKAACLGTLIALTATMSGIIAIDFYSTTILIDVGLSPSAAQYASVAIFVQCLISAIFGSAIVDRTGRRCLLLSTTASLILTHAALMVFSVLYEYYRISWAGALSVAACIIFALTFGMGPSVLQWTVTSEMVPQNARSTVQSIAMCCQRLASITVGLAFYPLQGAIGPYAFMIFTIPLIVFFFIFVKFFPETKQRTVVDIMHTLGYKSDNSIAMENLKDEVV